ncbi:hypothetical protein NKDENANG_03568 [Candidatus Entotheonellaceae bacterium PAL068K]
MTYREKGLGCTPRIRSVSLRQLLLKQTPAIGTSFLIAELFYKFYSFTLECLAFLVTWCLLDRSIHVIRRYLSTQR